MNQFLHDLLVNYGYIAGAALVFGFITLCVFFTPYVFKLLNVLSDKYLSEKISARVHDAMKKVELVVSTVISAESKMYEEEIIKALKDGKLEQKEVVEIAEKLATKAMELLTPEVNTLKSYLAGEGLYKLLVDTVKRYMVDKVTAEGAKKLDPFVSKIAPSTNGTTPPNS